ncbi:MAG: hypothetical protein A2X77_04595 [Gammaproteobacteria bacterium GWE2_42_36]|nr:MAG: hypothetical protein A2X77_04595 [Gammaproteobacteria bacterium GWE2_42_36]
MQDIDRVLGVHLGEIEESLFFERNFSKTLLYCRIALRELQEVCQEKNLNYGQFVTSAMTSVGEISDATLEGMRRILFYQTLCEFETKPTHLRYNFVPQDKISQIIEPLLFELMRVPTEEAPVIRGLGFFRIASYLKMLKQYVSADGYYQLAIQEFKKIGQNAGNIYNFLEDSVEGVRTEMLERYESLKMTLETLHTEQQRQLENLFTRMRDFMGLGCYTFVQDYYASCPRFPFPYDQIRMMQFYQCKQELSPRIVPEGFFNTAAKGLQENMVHVSTFEQLASVMQCIVSGIVHIEREKDQYSEVQGDIWPQRRQSMLFQQTGTLLKLFLSAQEQMSVLLQRAMSPDTVIPAMEGVTFEAEPPVQRVVTTAPVSTEEGQKGMDGEVEEQHLNMPSLSMFLGMGLSVFHPITGDVEEQERPGTPSPGCRK